jgi:hypothetical protein
MNECMHMRVHACISASQHCMSPARVPTALILSAYRRQNPSDSTVHLPPRVATDAGAGAAGGAAGTVGPPASLIASVANELVVGGPSKTAAEKKKQKQKKKDLQRRAAREALKAAEEEESDDDDDGTKRKKYEQLYKYQSSSDDSDLEEDAFRRVRLDIVKPCSNRYLASNQPVTLFFHVVFVVAVVAVAAIRKWNWKRRGPFHALFDRSPLQRKRHRYTSDVHMLSDLVNDACCLHLCN